MTNKLPSFVPKERDALPRIMVIDFDDDLIRHLTDSGYTVIAGYSGLGEKYFVLPKHESEIELVLWDISNLPALGQMRIADKEYGVNSPMGSHHLAQAVEHMKRYCKRVRSKGGFVGIFMGDVQASTANNLLSDMLGVDFSFFTRRTTTLQLNPTEQEDIWFEFFKRFVSGENIRYGISWNDNYVSLQRYFSDEDDNWYALYFHKLALIPKIENSKKKDAMTFLLQDVLPTVCKGDIFPDKFYYQWANKDVYLPPSVQRLKQENIRIAAEAEQQIVKNNAAIETDMANSAYLSNMLIADDSELFPEDKKLSVSVHKVLEDDLGFTVTDVDAMRLQVGESLKEDKWVEDAEGFFALVEIKGTERGAKANWVRSDLNAHIREFEVVKDITGLQSVLIFNHERRTEPEERSIPFNGDSDLIEYCKKSGIRLVPVYELFKMARDVKDGLITSDIARKILKESSGLFSYTLSATKKSGM